MVVPWTRTQLGRRSFHVAAPIIGNVLPVYHSTSAQHISVDDNSELGWKTRLFNQVLTYLLWSWAGPKIEWAAVGGEKTVERDREVAGAERWAGITEKDVSGNFHRSCSAHMLWRQLTIMSLWVASGVIFIYIVLIPATKKMLFIFWIILSGWLHNLFYVRVHADTYQYLPIGNVWYTLWYYYLLYSTICSLWH